ncbi:MAG TPA: hypothetical protein VI248_07625 [Kineosporiaceae bacterium]
MSVREPRRAAQAAAIGAIGVPAALIAHLVVTGAPASAAAGLGVTLAVVAVAAVAPTRTTAGLALVTAVTQLAAHTVLAVLPSGAPGQGPACIPAVGRAATLGLHLAVLRTDGACPSGTLAVDGLAVTAATALGVAAAILAGNAAVALLTGLLLGRAVLAEEVLTCLAGVLLRVLTRTATLLRWLPRMPLGAVPPRRPRRTTRPAVTDGWLPGPVAWRGPPRVAAFAP